jgi:GH25 family lysozyme M1 (1,4-beta-N-acetylmuramidase)
MDVSYAQGKEVDFHKMAEAGVKYCFIRVGSGQREKDENFEHNYAEAGKAGMLRGIYYYLYPENKATIGDAVERTPEGQARRFVSLLKEDAELGAVLDVEQPGLPPEEVKRFIDEFQKHDPFDRPITIYTAAWFWNKARGYAGSAVEWAAGHPLWVAHYTSKEEPIEPSNKFQIAIPEPWQHFVVHQWTSVGGPLLGHVKKGLDLNYFAGSLADLQEWARSGVITPPKEIVDEGTKFVTAKHLNVRSGPSTDDDIKMALDKGTAVKIIGKEGQWYSIEVDGVTGYVSGRYLSDTPSEEPVETTPKEKPVISTKKIDMASYFLPPEGQDAGDIVILKNNFGQGDERQQLQREKSGQGQVSYVTKNQQFEKRVIGDKTINLVLDTSPGGGEMYVVQGQWLPRHWAEGEDFTRKEVVTFLKKSDGKPVPGKDKYNSESKILFAKHHDEWTSPGNIKLSDVVELHWIAGGRIDERYWFASNLGLVGWQKYDGRESHIVELIKRGNQKDNERESIPAV